MKETLPARVRFGVFELDVRTGELRSGDRKMVLQEQPLRVLQMLLERECEIVTREEIKKKLWPNDTAVEFDHGINTVISNLRRALGDSADEPKYIETLARRGYRLMVPVERTDVADPSSGDGIPVPMQHETVGLIGKKVSHYRVLEVIGGGGMGVVYKAEDLKLGRRVALKFLPEDLASDPVALQRFEREARTASSLNHPNICTIYEVEEHDGQPFIVMELLEGQTLRDRLAGATASAKALPLDELLEIAVQVCDGLEAAHRKNIIHRDIKPANIFLTTPGQVKILDFGLAKLVVEAPGGVAVEAPDFSPATSGERESGLQPRPGLKPDIEEEPTRRAEAQRFHQPTIQQAEPTLTRTGVAMGTAGYMSPEQVQGEKLDARTDLFSFGLVLYEMATGQRAFSGETASVVEDAILHHSPVPVRELNSTLPARLVSTIDKALEKDRETRYQSAAEMHADLGRLSRGRAQALLRRRWTWIIAAALPMILAAIGGLYWRGHNRISLTNEDTIVLADFTNRTSDPVFDDALNRALRQGLEQTPFLHVLTFDKVRGALRSLSHPEDAKLTADLARDVCQQSGSKVYVAGSIADIGNHYRIALQAVNCQTAKPFARTEVNVEGRNQVIKVLGLAGRQLRSQLGEPTWSLQKFNTPLEEATTASLEAMQAYTQSVKTRISAGDADALAVMKRAVELDPNFVLAHVELGAYFYNLNEATLAARSLKRAYELRNRVDQHTRYWMQAMYYDVGTGELEKANDTYVQWIQTFPADAGPHRNYSESLKVLGDYEMAAAQAGEAVRASPETSTYELLIMSYINMNRLHAAKAVFDDAKEHKLDGWLLRSYRYVVAFLEDDKPGMQEQLKWAEGRPEAADWLLAQQGDTAIHEGRFRASQKFYLAREVGPWTSVAANKAHESLRAAETGDTAKALETGAEALVANPKRNDRVLLALAFARAGDGTQAQSLIEELNQEFPLATLVQKYEIPTIRAAIQLRRKDPEGAIKTLQATTPYDVASPPSFRGLYLYPVYVRGLAYLQVGDGKNAAIEFQRMLDHSGLLQDSIMGPLARLQLGRAQVMMGDKAAARKSYQDFLTLWKDADPDIPIYKQAKAEYAKLR